jgi:hypothetical protein
MKPKSCRWSCARKTDRRCGICLTCCDARDERHRDIDAGKLAYVPPDKRLGHRLYKGDKALSESKKAALTKAATARIGQIPRPNAPGEAFGRD